MSTRIDPAKLIIEKTSKPKTKLPKEQLKFGATTSDHMLEIDWSESKGWSHPRIIPYGNLSVDPAASTFHYALECFEGFKAYRDDQNRIRLFRPERNMDRLNVSCQRLLFPPIDKEGLLSCIKQLVRVDRDWVPQGFGYSLYVRPCVISTYPYVGVSPSKQIKVFVITCPVGPYYATGFAPVRLLADENHVRAWPGGTGDVKIGANYALGIQPAAEAAKRGYHQILWVFGSDHQVTEVGTMNQFFFWRKPNGGRELVTAALDGTVLPGVTRDSILSLARTWKEFDVSERRYTITDVIAAVKENRMIEAFGAGTAAIVSPVNSVGWKGVDYPIPLDPADTKQKAGPLTRRLMDTIMSIQYGRTPHPEWSIILD